MDLFCFFLSFFLSYCEEEDEADEEGEERSRWSDQKRGEPLNPLLAKELFKIFLMYRKRSIVSGGVVELKGELAKFLKGKPSRLKEKEKSIQSYTVQYSTML